MRLLSVYKIANCSFKLSIICNMQTFCVNSGIQQCQGNHHIKVSFNYEVPISIKELIRNKGSKVPISRVFRSCSPPYNCIAAAPGRSGKR